LKSKIWTKKLIK